MNGDDRPEAAAARSVDSVDLKLDGLVADLAERIEAASTHPDARAVVVLYESGISPRADKKSSRSRGRAHFLQIPDLTSPAQLLDVAPAVLAAEPGELWLLLRDKTRTIDPAWDTVVDALAEMCGDIPIVVVAGGDGS